MTLLPSTLIVLITTSLGSVAWAALYQAELQDADNGNTLGYEQQLAGGAAVDVNANLNMAESAAAVYSNSLAEPAKVYKASATAQHVLVNDDGYGKDDYHKEEKHYHHQPYGFGYNVEDGYGNKQWRHEKSSQPHSVSGSYGFQDKNGIVREVEYVADKHGFRAVVKTNEPGTAPKDPAYVKMNSNPIHIDYKPEYKSEHGYGKSKDYHHEPVEHYQGHQGGGYHKKEMKYDDNTYKSPGALGGALGGLQDAYDGEYAVVGAANSHPTQQNVLAGTIGASAAGGKYAPGGQKVEQKSKYQDKKRK